MQTTPIPIDPSARMGRPSPAPTPAQHQKSSATAERSTPRATDISAESKRATIAWTGGLFQPHSLAHVNRELCAGLVERGHVLTFQRSEADAYEPLRDRERHLIARVDAAIEGEPDILVRHAWPPDFSSAKAKRLVLIQPWEYSSLPKAWIAPMNAHVDEIWVPSNFVRDAYVRSGVDAARVAVVPNGVDTRRFHPHVAPRPLATKKSIKFLFVGGALPRKGIHILLEAWTRAFHADDDVALVVKDFGARTFYRGQTLADLVHSTAANPNVAEIVYSDETLADDEMPALYTACDALVHPYLGEGFGLPIAEAMACALPVVITDHGAAEDFCDDSCAYLIPSRAVKLPEARVGDLETVEAPIVREPDVDALARILRLIASDLGAARRKGWLAREKIRAGFTWDHAVDACEARIAALVAAPPRNADVRVRFGAAPFNYSGYARVTRMLLPEVERLGADVQLQAYALDRRFLAALPASDLRTWRGMLARSVDDGVHVAFHPPVGWDGQRFFANAVAQSPRALAHVGFTMFETDRLPRGWAAELSTMDEVWVPCRFNFDTFAAAGVPREKLRLFQPGLDLAPFRELPEPYRIPGQAGFTFLSVFQWTRRKGWDVLLDAYVRAFKRSDDVCLVIRAYPGEVKEPPIRDRIDAYLKTLGTDRRHAPRIVLIDEFVSESDMPSLYAAADAYVLPTRGEGFGLPFLEAMAAGLPTIGTRWSGHLDFMDDETSYLIDVDGLEPVDPEMTAENAYYESDHQWARPNVEHTARLMRQVFEGRDEARARGAKARERVFAEWGAERSARDFGELVRDLTRRAPRAAARDESSLAPPIVWHGPLLDASGYADEGRQFVFGLDALGLRVRSAPLSWGKPTALDTVERETLSRTASVTILERSVIVEHGFGDSMKRMDSALATVGRTMYETDRIPATWVAPLNTLDEVWVPSDFNIDTFASSGVERAKLFKVHGAIDAARYAQLPAAIELEGGRGFNFLAVFDWNRRKGWDVLVRAFVEAFRARDDVALIVKTHSSLGLSPEAIRDAIRQYVERDLARSIDSIPTIRLITTHFGAGDMLRLYTAADAYVMPSRGEGWGRPYMDAMACGLPTIGTRFGGNLEFMDDANSYLIDAELVDVSREAVAENALFAGHRWAEPSVAHLVETMQRVRRDASAAKKRGARARAEVLERFDRKRVAESIRARLLVLNEKAKR